MRAISSPKLFHGAIEKSYNGERIRKLWRIDWLNENCFLLILGPEKCDYSHIVEQFGYPDIEKAEMKDYNSLLMRLEEGQIWQFRLTANPVRSSIKEKGGKTGRGKIFAHVTTEQQKQWLHSRADALGFNLNYDSYDIVHAEWKKFSKGKDGKREVTLRTAMFEGTLTISDIELFKESLVKGIGRAKSYGCGLLTITRN